jgi:D-alanyl-D-alanine carboxypeptidase
MVSVESNKAAMLAPGILRASKRRVPSGLVISGLFVAAAAFAMPAAAQAGVKGAIVIDEDSGKVISSYRADLPHPPASLTKMMTLYLTFEALDKGRLKLDQKVTISRYVSRRRPSKLYLKAGSKISIRTLIRGTAVKSANDAAAALAEAVAGSEAKFAQLMTLKARALGMTRTQFGNASGLPSSGQVTSARDMAILARAIFRNYSHHYHFFSQRYFRYGRRVYRNTNRLLHRYAAVDGMKTGYTRRARYNLVTSAVRGKQRIIIVVLGASSSNLRYRTTERLMARAWGKVPRGPALTASNDSKPAKARAKAKINLSVARKAKAGDYYQVRYGIQVGSYRSYGTARKVMRRAIRRIPYAHRMGTRPLIVALRQRRGKVYKVRFIGMTAKRASRACYAAKRKGLRCTTVRYNQRIARVGNTKGGGRVSKAAARAKTPDAKETYAIQVGASRKFSGAKRSLRKAQRVLPRKYAAGTKPRILKPSTYSGSLYRARFIGMSKSEAKAACRVLRKHHVRCLALEHSV